jgi:UDP-N-acetylglucosamine 2-epimerase (non-hydrolysing)/GDP/UDP-N,N'-diacetylbacillosamine 2-epimerase (hydrolysing)
MQPVHRAIAAEKTFDLHLIVTGMHFLPEFLSGLEQVRADKLGQLHELNILVGDDSGRAMAVSVGRGVVAIAELLEELKPDIVLLQGDRGEMLAAAIAAAHMNIAIVHMSGGDCSGSIDDSVRNAISKLAHFHLTNSDASSRRLIATGESSSRIVEVGDPALDQIRTMEFLPLDRLATELKMPRGQPFLIATMHPVTDEVEQAARQMRIVLEALEEFGVTTIFSYPNGDAGGRAMRDVLESWRGRTFLRIEPNLGSQRYLSLLRHAAAMVGNSSSGFFEAPSFRLPVVNVGTRQQNRTRACNIVDAACERADIIRALRYVLQDAAFRSALANCKNPYGDGRAAERTADILQRLQLGSALIAKWQPSAGPFLAAAGHGI